MSDSIQNQTQTVKLGGRGRKTAKSHKKKGVIVVGKVYANWCGHCQALKPEWAKMKRNIHNKNGKNRIVFVEIEESEINSKLNKLNQEHNVNVQANGYPTLFRIEGGKVDYYGGNRESSQMSQWFLKGGNPLGQEKAGQDQQIKIPGLLQDVQGGGRKYNFSRQRTKRYRPSNKKRATGLFDFLCGK